MSSYKTHSSNCKYYQFSQIVAKKKKEYYDSKTADSDSSDLSTGVFLERLVAYNEANKMMDDIRLRDEALRMFLAVITSELCDTFFKRANLLETVTL